MNFPELAKCCTPPPHRYLIFPFTSTSVQQPTGIINTSNVSSCSPSFRWPSEPFFNNQHLQTNHLASYPCAPDSINFYRQECYAIPGIRSVLSCKLFSLIKLCLVMQRLIITSNDNFSARYRLLRHLKPGPRPHATHSRYRHVLSGILCILWQSWELLMNWTFL